MKFLLKLLFSPFLFSPALIFCNEELELYSFQEKELFTTPFLDDDLVPNFSLEDFNGPKFLEKELTAFEHTPPFFEDNRKARADQKKAVEQKNEQKEALKAPQELEVNLNHPVFQQGVIKTEQGGVVNAAGLRIQAQKIEYTNRVENGILVQKVVAEGDLLVEYGENAFVGSKLEFDFVKKTGTLLDGKTFVNVWFLGGEKIELKEDGSYFIYNAYITTCESQDSSWDIHAGKVKISKDQLLSAHNIRFRFVKIPIFWFPTFRSNLRVFKDSPIRYKVTWDKGLGPRATMRYRLFSWENLDLFFRLDYRLKRGFGVAIESEYYSPDERTVFLSKNYGAHDKSVPDERTNKRYRFQGLYHSDFNEKRTQVHLTYDKISDDKMPGDFKSDDFEINTQKRTILLIDHLGDNFYSTLRFQPRINNFQSLNQLLPLIIGGLRPFSLGNSGIISQNSLSMGYLDYVYVHDLRKYIPERHAARLETQNQFYRPIPLNYFTLTPHVGFIGIFYNNNPEHHSIGQAIMTYGFKADTRFSHLYTRLKHTIEPYMEYKGFSHPTAANDKHFIFNIDDGYHELNQLRLGVRNLFFSPKRSFFTPSFTTDLYTYGFFKEDTFRRVFPKIYMNASWNRPFYTMQAGVAWNWREQVLDYSNIRTDITVNENLAFGLEFRHRSKYDWRKADHDNFFLDVTRQIDQLVHSPLSDGRNTLLTRVQVNLSPTWSCHFQSHHGWGRKNEPAYNETKVELFHIISCSWRLKIAYMHSENDDRFTGGISLVK